jgi:16S rRNA (cytidine1402-2'-O)-methyltransferase
MSTDKTLYMVGTPIGNLEDFSPRALRVLKHVGTVFSEDTRVTAKLLASFDIQVTCKSINEHTTPPAIRKMLDSAEGDIAYVTDAGMPGISDPGGKVVEIARELGINIVTIPGPSAVTAILSVSGFPTQQFTMMGFPPHKKGRKTFFEQVAKIEHTTVLFESKHRFLKTLAELPQDRLMTVGRELTKMHEEVATGLAGEIADKLSSAKGEFTIVLAPTWYK